MTARNEAYSFYADGNLLYAGEKTYCECLQVNVVNTLFDPAVPPTEEDATSLSIPLAKEIVQYSIRKNTIEVTVSHTFSDTTTNSVKMYYGMQSMFVNEEYVMTPMGKHIEWTEANSTSGNWSKSQYPNFNRFLECNKSNGTYQAAFLYPETMGNHKLIQDNNWIFNRSSSKCYHHLMQNVDSIAGKTFEWSGGYTFFHTPIIDSDNIFAYTGIFKGKDALFINTKKAFTGTIDLPENFRRRTFSVLEKSDAFTSFSIVSSGISLEASDSGSLILVLD